MKAGAKSIFGWSALCAAALLVIAGEIAATCVLRARTDARLEKTAKNAREICTLGISAADGEALARCAEAFENSLPLAATNPPSDPVARAALAMELGGLFRSGGMNGSDADDAAEIAVESPELAYLTRSVSSVDGAAVIALARTERGASLRISCRREVLPDMVGMLAGIGNGNRLLSLSMRPGQGASVEVTALVGPGDGGGS